MSAPAPRSADRTVVDGDVYVAPRYLAGSPGHGDPGFAPVAHWPHHHLDDGPHQLVVTSPDHRIRIGWAGDDYELWTITAAPDAVSAPRWEVTFNQNTPPELVAPLTAQLATDWADGNDRFLAAPSYRWADSVGALTEAGWTRRPGERGTVELTAPDHSAGLLIDRYAADGRTWMLWAGPKGWGTRAEITFTARTPAHLIAAVAQAFTDPAPVPRWRETLDPRLAAMAQLTPVAPPRPTVPTPRDIRPRVGVRPPAPAASVPRWTTVSTPSAPLPVRSAPRR